MQSELKQAATWYIQNHTNDIAQIEEEIIKARRVRNKAIFKGTIDQIEHSFAAVEILWAAYCLLTDREYDTDFSPYSLDLISSLAA